MIPDLGKYAVEVLAAYGVSLVVLMALIALSTQRARRVARDLRAVEHKLREAGEKRP